MIKSISTTAFLIFVSLMLGTSQDTLSIKSTISLDLKGQHNVAALTKNFDCYNCTQNSISDNPLHHFAIYFGVVHELEINNKYKIETGVFSEERSHSGGNNTLSNIILFPKILLQANDTISLFNKEISTAMKGGDYWDEDVDDILRLYNIDYHGIEISFSHKNWSLMFFTIGDLSENVGLDFTQLYRTSIAYEKERFKNVFHFSKNELSVGGNRTHLSATDWNFSNYLKFSLGENILIKGQLGLRVNPALDTGIGLAVNGTYNSPKLIITSSLRYYQRSFNQGYNGRQPRYAGFGTYVGEQLYPLKNYYRPFSQWSAYTHLENRSLLGIELAVQWETKLYKQIYYFNDFDINLIRDITNGEQLVYPFYNLGLECKFLNQFIGRISMTNKHMELRTYYQTSSASKASFLSFGVQFNLSRIELASKDLVL